MDPIIELTNVSKNFVLKRNEVVALKNVNLQFFANQTTTLIGASGSGKSTLLRCINGLEFPTSGKVSVLGEEISRKTRLRLSTKVGMVFQNFNLFPHFSVKDNLVYGPVSVLGYEREKATSQAAEMLDKFGLRDKFFSMPNNLSGGQKQRVAICRALMMHPKVMLFDEPTSALDPEIIKDVIDIILSLKSEVSNIIVTHHIKFAQKVADRVVFMDQGLILSDQPKEEFFTKPKSHRARLFLENIGDL